MDADLPDPRELTPREAALAEAEAHGVTSVETLIARVRSYHADMDEARLREAYATAAEAHYGQRRKSGEPYFAHPVAVAMILTDLRLDVDTLVTALLHDTVEDTELTLACVRKSFGASVAGLVDGVTKLSQVAKASGASLQGENLKKFVLAVASDVRVLLVKLADRLHNMRTLEHLPDPKKRERKARETMEIYAPLARRIGVQRLCGELEDLSFRWVNPGAHESIHNRLAKEREARASAAAEVSHALTRRLEAAGIAVHVYGREKRAYSIWRKLDSRGIDFDDIADLYGFRIIVGSVEDCYAALGVAHATWRCVPGRFKDYISTPKPNNYQSIHTTVMGPDSQRVELQIRTEEMERIAEDGVAAHWRYKNKSYGYDPEAAQAAGGDTFANLKPLFEILQDGGEADEFLEHAKLEMFADQVFAFTPKGDVIALPKGATPLDFAYAVHTQVGDTCVGAEVNGLRVPLRTTIRNGDVVRIIRSGTPEPPPGWQDIAVTGRARSAIRRLVRRSRRTEMHRLGKAAAEHAFRREGLDLATASLADALVRLGQPDEEHLFVEMGLGRISGRKLLRAVFPNREIDEAPGAARQLIDDDKAGLFVQGGGLTQGVGLHLCRACSPLPGDRIVAILCHGQDVEAGEPEPGVGAVVHAIDCALLEALENEQDRWLDISWSNDATERSISVGRVSATVSHAQGVLAEIAGAVSRAQGNITGLRILSRATDFFDMEFDVEVVDAHHLSNIVAAMRACPSVASAERARSREDILAQVGSEECP